MTKNNGRIEMKAKVAAVKVNSLFPIFLVKEGLYFNFLCGDDVMVIDILNSIF